MAGPVVIFLSSGGWAQRYQAATLALTAAAFGDPVHLALSADALSAWLGGRFDEGAPPTAAAARVASLRVMLDEGRRDLGVRVVACETAVRLAGFSPDEAAASLDGIVGLPELWRIARAGRAVAF